MRAIEKHNCIYFIKKEEENTYVLNRRKTQQTQPVNKNKEKYLITIRRWK